jgi:hypothetical protein
VKTMGAKLTRREMGEALLALGIVAATGTLAGSKARAGAQTSRVLARAQRAVATGGASPVRALVLRGFILTGFNAATAKLMEPPAELEIRVLLPDHYLNLQTRGSHLLNTGIRGKVGFFGAAGSVRPVPPETADELRADVARLLVRCR